MKKLFLLFTLLVCAMKPMVKNGNNVINLKLISIINGSQCPMTFKLQNYKGNPIEEITIPANNTITLNKEIKFFTNYSKAMKAGTFRKYILSFDNAEKAKKLGEYILDFNKSKQNIGILKKENIYEKTGEVYSKLITLEEINLSRLKKQGFGIQINRDLNPKIIIIPKTLVNLGIEKIAQMKNASKLNLENIKPQLPVEIFEKIQKALDQ